MYNGNKDSRLQRVGLIEVADVNNSAEVKRDANREINSYSPNGRLISICTHPRQKLSCVAPLITGNLSKSALAHMPRSRLLLLVFTPLFISALLYSFNLLLYFGSFFGALESPLTLSLPSGYHSTFSVSYSGFLKDLYTQAAFIYLLPNLF